MITTDKLAIAKEIIKKNIDNAEYGLYNTPNIIGDTMSVLYNKNGLKILICYGYSYFEVFGLSEKEFIELDEYYCSKQD